MKKKIKSIIWKIIRHLPGKLEYLVLYIIDKHKLPNIINPRDYSEFIARDMLLNRNHNKAFLADKYKVREFVAQKGLNHTLTELYGVWDDANKINFDLLPDKFALKLNHSCAMNIICTDKEKLNKSEAIKQLNTWLNSKHPISYESHYKKIKPLIIGEEFISDNSGVFPMDYKIHCAHGEPVFIQLAFERNENSPGRRIIFDTKWNNLHFVVDDDYHFANYEAPRPKHLEEMLKYASILSKDLDYARIDFYDTDDRVIFGEITLTPMGGWLNYFKQEALDFMGEKIRNTKNKIRN